MPMLPMPAAPPDRRAGRFSERTRRPIAGRQASNLLGRGHVVARLAGRTHQVRTGVCVIFPGGTRKVFHETTDVTFLPLDAGAIDDYLSRVNPLDKAGAYGIQEHGELIVERIDGSFENVMGLPVEQVLAVLAIDG